MPCCYVHCSLISDIGPHQSDRPHLGASLSRQSRHTSHVGTRIRRESQQAYGHSLAAERLPRIFICVRIGRQHHSVEFRRERGVALSRARVAAVHAGAHRALGYALVGCQAIMAIQNQRIFQSSCSFTDCIASFQNQAIFRTIFQNENVSQDLFLYV